MKYATIIGSRTITNNEKSLLSLIALKLSNKGYILRSGGADGSDSVVNVFYNVEIFIPWNGFNDFQHDGKRIFVLDKLPDKTLAEKKALSLHEAPDALSKAALKLHTRNIYQVIGKNGSNGIKSDFVIFCSDSDSKDLPIGGTRTAVKFAKSLNIPCYNIRNINDLASLEKILI
jgi:hypothetical protein